jgi:hypothetical protein
VNRKSELLFGDVNDLSVGERFGTKSKESILSPVAKQQRLNNGRDWFVERQASGELADGLDANDDCDDQSLDEALNQQLQEAARSPHDRVGVLDAALCKIAEERLQPDAIGVLLVLPDLSESDCARTQSGLRLGTLRIDDGCRLEGRL